MGLVLAPKIKDTFIYMEELDTLAVEYNYLILEIGSSPIPLVDKVVNYGYLDRHFTWGARLGKAAIGFASLGGESSCGYTLCLLQHQNFSYCVLRRIDDVSDLALRSLF